MSPAVALIRMIRGFTGAVVVSLRAEYWKLPYREGSHHAELCHAAPGLACVRRLARGFRHARARRCTQNGMLLLPCASTLFSLWTGQLRPTGADELRFGRRRVKVGQALYREGDRFQSLYAVRSGTFKSSLMLPDGREQVNAFFMAGEMMGLDGIAYGFHASSVTALEDAEVCVIPYALLTEMSAGKTDLQQLITRLMSQEILRENSIMMMLGSMAADERLAAFLLNRGLHPLQ